MPTAIDAMAQSKAWQLMPSPRSRDIVTDRRPGGVPPAHGARHNQLCGGLLHAALVRRRCPRQLGCRGFVALRAAVALEQAGRPRTGLPAQARG